MTSQSGTDTPSTKKNGRRGSGFPETKLSELFMHIGYVLPITSHDWENVCTLLAEKFSSKTPEALKHKFKSLVRAKPNIGDPDCPWQVRTTKTLLSTIRTKTESTIENIDSSETEDDDG